MARDADPDPATGDPTDLPPPAPQRVVTDEELAALHAWCDGALAGFLADLATLVNVDCGSYTKAGVDLVGRWIAAELGRLGAGIQVVPDPDLGDTVIARFRGRGGPRLLLIGHLDTVFDVGTAAERPFRVEDGRARGPGVADMKAGLLAGLYALRALQALGTAGQSARDDSPTAEEPAPSPEPPASPEWPGAPAPASPPPASSEPASSATVDLPWLPFDRVTFVVNPDEEIGSPSSTAIITEAARRHDVALVLECARANGDIVSARKGLLDLGLQLTGRAAHAGVEPEMGRSAILEAAHKTIAIQGLGDPAEGVTCNVGVVLGGTRPNVVAERTTLEVDVRAPTRQALEGVEAEIRRIAEVATIPGVTCEVSVLARHWPMEKTPEGAGLAERVRALAAAFGLEIRDAATGGASDANTTAGLGVPTLDGLGPVGGMDHSPDEYVEVDSIAPRVTLLAALLLSLARDPVAAVSPG